MYSLGLEVYIQLSNIRFDVVLVIHTEFALRCFSRKNGSCQFQSLCVRSSYNRAKAHSVLNKQNRQFLFAIRHILLQLLKE